MGRQHFPVGVDVDAFSLRLLQQQLQIVKIVAGDDDEGAFLDGQAHLSRLRMTKGFRICLVQHGHALEIDFAHFHHDGQQLLHAPVIHTNSKQSLVQEIVDGIVLVTQYSGMIGIGGDTTNAEQDQGLKASDILVSIPQFAHIVVIVPTTGGSAFVALGYQLPLFNIYPFHNSQQCIVIEVHIGQGSKQSFHDDSGSGITDNMLVAFGGTGQADQRPGQLVLKFRCISLFTADTQHTFTGLAASGLFTLKTKHSQLSFI